MEVERKRKSMEMEMIHISDSGGVDIEGGKQTNMRYFQWSFLSFRLGLNPISALRVCCAMGASHMQVRLLQPKEEIRSSSKAETVNDSDMIADRKYLDRGKDNR